MPAGQRRMAMMLFGTALLSLVFFSSCSGDVGATGTSGTTTRPATSTSEPPKSVPVSPTSPSAGSVSPAVVGKISKTTDKTTTNTSISSVNTTQSTTQSPTKAGGAESLTQKPMTTSNPNVTLSAKDQNNKTMARPDTLNSTTDTPQKVTEATTTNTTDLGKKGDQSPTDSGAKDDSSYSSILLPVIIALIVISLVIFLLMALYKICLKTTPERQENGTEQAPSDKENVKLISVKTTSPETGEQSSQGKNKTRQHDSSSHLSNKCV